jgi:hypothetical protein
MISPRQKYLSLLRIVEPRNFRFMDLGYGIYIVTQPHENPILLMERLHHEIIPKRLAIGDNLFLGGLHHSSSSGISRFIESDKFDLYSLSNSIKDRVIALFDRWNFKVSSEWPTVLTANLEEVTKLLDNVDLIGGPLGIYIPVFNIIIIDTDKITELSVEVELLNDDNEDSFNFVFEKVLLHELGHWISHESLIDGKHWTDEHFINSSSEVLEFWSQIICYYLSKGKVKYFLKEFSHKQSSEYQNFMEFIDLNEEDVLFLLTYREEDNWQQLQTRLQNLKNKQFHLN